jgi:hypothetical protein
VAKKLGVPSAELRQLTWSVPALMDVALELAHQLIDDAEQGLRDALRGDDPYPATKAAIFILRRCGWDKGYGNSLPQRRVEYDDPAWADDVVVDSVAEDEAAE